MPVTAKLSRKFYDTFGDDVANELVEWFNAVDLTYRTDLRELNELNHARFEAKLDQGLAGFDAKLARGLSELGIRLHRRTGELEAGLRKEMSELEARLMSRLEARLDGTGHRFDGIDQRLGRMDQRFDGIDRRLDGIDQRLDRMDQRFDGIDQRVEAIRTELIRDIAEARMATEALGSELRIKMAVDKADLIKWMFLFWLGTVAASVAGRFF